jgi:hypothetical protein
MCGRYRLMSLERIEEALEAEELEEFLTPSTTSLLLRKFRSRGRMMVGWRRT